MAKDQFQIRINKPGLLTLTIKDRARCIWRTCLCADGGLFIPTSSNYSLGDEVFMCSISWVRMRSCPSPVVSSWVTPRVHRASARRASACSFRTGSRQTRNKIENYLAGALFRRTRPLTRCSAQALRRRAPRRHPARRAYVGVEAALHQDKCRSGAAPASVAVERHRAVRDRASKSSGE